MMKPLRVQRTVKTFTEDYGFQPRWSNRDQIYPPMLNIWKKKLDELWINNFQTLDNKRYGTMTPTISGTNEVSAMMLRLTPWMNFQAILRERKLKQVSDLLELKRHIWKLRRSRQLRFAGNSTGEERAAWQRENFTDRQLRGPAEDFSQPWTTRGNRENNC